MILRKHTKRRSRADRRKNLFLAMVPLFVLFLLLGLVELGLHVFDISDRDMENLFDLGAKFVPDQDAGFKLKTNVSLCLDKKIENIPDDVQVVGCFGDSVTFGSGYKPQFSYPAQLQKLFDRQYKGGKVRVVNLGIPAYTSEQGKRQFLKMIKSLTFDIVILGYGFNDSQFVYVGDRKILDRARWLKPVRWFIDNCYLVQTAHSFIRRTKQRDARMVRRVSLSEYRENLQTMITSQHNQGGDSLLLNLEFGNNYTHSVSRQLAEKSDLAYLDLPNLFQERCWQKGLELTANLGLSARPSILQGVMVVSVLLPDCSADNAVKLLYFSEEHFSYQLNETLCMDNGVFPDEVANDCVWTAEVSYSPDQPFHYIYRKMVKGKYRSEFPKFDKPENPRNNWHTRIYLPVKKGEQIVPLVQFGQRTLKKEYIHPNQAGYYLIAETIYPKVVQILANRAQ